MGQRSSRCKEAEKDFGRVYKFHHGAPPSFTSLVIAHPASVGEEDVGGKKKNRKEEDTFKKKKRFRLRRWTSCWRAGQKYSRKTRSAQGEDEAQGSDGAAVASRSRCDDHFTCSVENHNHQEPSTSDPEVSPVVEEHLAVHPDAVVLRSPLWSDNVTQTPVDTVSDLSADIAQTPVLCTASDWSIDADLTPVFTAWNWRADVTQTPVRTMSDWSIDITQTPVRHTASNWSIDVSQTPVRTASDWNADVTQTLRTVSNWSPDVTRTPVQHIDSSWSTGVTQTPTCVSNWSDGVDQTPVRHTDSDWSINVTQTPVLTVSDWTTGDTQTPTCVSNWSDGVDQTPVRHTDSDWSINVTQTPVLTVSDWSTGVTQTPTCVSNRSDDVDQTPVRHTDSDWSISIAQTPVLTVSDWSTVDTQTPTCVSNWSDDVDQTPVRHTDSDWSISIAQTPVLTVSNWSTDVPQTPGHTASDWSIDVIQTSLSPIEVSVSPLTRQLENCGKMKTEVINSCHYVIGDMLGEGTFGAVYEGSRLQDGFKVAVKYVTKTENVEYISILGHSKPLPLEVALLILANRGSSIPEIIQLLDWQDRHDHYIMVMECPSPCEDLFTFAELHGGSIDEALARGVMRQATQAAYMCCHRGVLHADIKLENLLINMETHKVKLIDFGCGDLLKKSAYKIFTGTDQYCPPEYIEKGEYNGKPATVWSLGVLLFALVCGDYPNTDDLNKINANNFSKAGLSDECCQLISCCLHREPEQRLRLSEILLHDWFKVTDLEDLKTV